MKYFMDNTKVRIEDLKTVAVYDKELLGELEKGHFEKLKELDEEYLENRDFMEPILYAMVHEFNTYEVYKYFGDKLKFYLKPESRLSSEIMINNPELMVDSPLAEAKELILENKERNPDIVKYISPELEDDEIFITKLCEGTTNEVLEEVIDKYSVKKLIEINEELCVNEHFMTVAISKDISALEYADKAILNSYDVFREASINNDDVIGYVIENNREIGLNAVLGVRDTAKEKANKSYKEVINENAEKGTSERFKWVKTAIENHGDNYSGTLNVMVGMAAQSEEVEPELIDQAMDYAFLSRVRLEKMMEEGKNYEISYEDYNSLIRPCRVNKLIQKSEKAISLETQQKWEEYVKFYEDFREKYMEQKREKNKTKRENESKGDKLKEEINGHSLPQEFPERTSDSLNTGKVVESIPPEMWEKAAIDFSEGNEELRQLLIYCFENGIKTRACCAGHDHGDRKTNPYINFEFEESNMNAIASIIKSMIEEKGISIDISKYPGGISSFQIDFLDGEAKFTKILEACKNRENIKEEDLSKVMQTILSTMQNHDGEKSSLEVNFQTDSRDYTLITDNVGYLGALNVEEILKLELWPNNTQILEGINKKDMVRIMEKINTKIIINRTIEKYKQKGCYSFIVQKGIVNENICRVDFFDNREEIKSTPIIPLEGVSIEQFAEEVIRLQSLGYATSAEFNNFHINSIEYSSAEDIVNAYENYWEMYIKEHEAERLSMKEEGLSEKETIELEANNECNSEVASDQDEQDVEFTSLHQSITGYPDKESYKMACQKAAREWEEQKNDIRVEKLRDINKGDDIAR